MQRTFQEVGDYLKVQGLRDTETGKVTNEGAQVLFVLLSLLAVEEKLYAMAYTREVNKMTPEGIEIEAVSIAAERMAAMVHLLQGHPKHAEAIAEIVEGAPPVTIDDITDEMLDHYMPEVDDDDPRQP